MNRKALFKELTKQGWTLTNTKNGHIKITSPNGGFCYTGSTPGDKRAYANLLADLRRLGFFWSTDTKGRR